jgi:hypothetical protein
MIQIWINFAYIFQIRGARWPCGKCARRAIAEAKQRWSVIGWVTKNLLSRAPPGFGRHVKPLVLAAFAVVSTHQFAPGPRGGLWPVLQVSFIRKGCAPAVRIIIGWWWWWYFTKKGVKKIENAKPKCSWLKCCTGNHLVAHYNIHRKNVCCDILFIFPVSVHTWLHNKNYNMKR